LRTITRNWIRDDAIFYAGMNGKYTKAELVNMIDYCKSKLIEAGAEPGMKIGSVVISIDILYTALLFAIFELDLKLVVLHRITSEKEKSLPKSMAHMPLDLFVCYDTLFRSEVSYSVQHFVEHSKKVIQLNASGDWNMDKIGKAEPTPIYAKPEDDLLLCSTSGTTGVPKLLSHTHGFLHDLCSYNGSEMDLEPDDVVLHLSSLNHGASLSVFYLPALKFCKNHFFNIQMIMEDASRQYEYIFESCRKNGITKLLSPNNFVTEEIIDAINRSDEGLPNTTIIILSFINPKWLPVVKSGKLKKIISAFGCTETGGPLFIPSIDKDTDVDTFNPKFLGKRTEGFYDTKQIDGSLAVDLNDGRRVFTDDKVKETPEGFYFVSKNKLKKISDVEINTLDIVESIDKYCSRSKFEIVIDEIHNELYIVTGDESFVTKIEEVRAEIAKLYPKEVQLNGIIYMPTYAEATIAVKPDRQKLLEYINKVCRGR
jgi:acyl-CoA synthetase (AMP-forming)/AMP-acid ligase II